MELNPRDTRHWPCFGSVLDYLSAREGNARAVPTQVALPWRFSSRSEPFRRGGPFGGFLGMGEEYYPVPWDMLSYDAQKGGYVADLTKEKLTSSPHFKAGQEPDWTDPAFGRSVDYHYGSPPI